MLAIKLKLIGKKGQHSFRVIVQEKRAKLQGKFTDDIGWHNPHANEFKIDQEKLKYWLDNGAQPTETVQKLIKNSEESSDVQSYKGRQNPKKKKKEKNAAAAPAPVEVSADGVEAPQEGEVVEEDPAKEDPAPVEEKEEAPIEESPKEEEAPKEE